jgi:hypothetical protein
MEKPKTITIKLYDKEDNEVINELVNELERLEEMVWDRVINGDDGMEVYYRWMMKINDGD